jgi:hypothetical protein
MEQKMNSDLEKLEEKLIFYEKQNKEEVLKLKSHFDEKIDEKTNLNEVQ